MGGRCARAQNHPPIRVFLVCSLKRLLLLLLFLFEVYYEHSMKSDAGICGWISPILYDEIPWSENGFPMIQAGAFPGQFSSGSYGRVSHVILVKSTSSDLLLDASKLPIFDTSNSHNSYTFKARSLKFCMDVHLDNL